MALLNPNRNSDSEEASLSKLLMHHFAVDPKSQKRSYDHIGIFFVDLADVLVFPGSQEVVLLSLAPDVELDADVAGQVEEIIQTRGYKDRLKLFEYSEASPDGLQVLEQVSGLAAFSRSALGHLKKTISLKDYITARLVERSSLSALNPYTYQGVVTGSRFFGRDEELKTLRLQTTKSFVLSGVRRSGKTSLMMELNRRIQLDQQDKELVVFVNFEACQSLADIPYQVLRRMAEKLQYGSPLLSEWSHNLKSLSNSRQWQKINHLSHLETTLWDFISSREEAHRVRFLFDEYDRVIDLERPHNRIFTKLWRDLVMRANTSFGRGRGSSGFVQFIFAGSRKLYEEILSSGSPFFNLGAERLRLQNFDLRTLDTLVTKPLRSLGVEVQDAAAVVEALLKKTGGHPATTQHLLSLVVSDPQTGQSRAVGVDDVKRAAIKHTFLGLLRDTLEMNVSPLGRFILAQMAANKREKVNADFVHGVARRHNIVCDENNLRVELQDLADSGYLRPLEFEKGQSFYMLAVPVVQELFSAEDVPHLIQDMLANNTCIAYHGADLSKR